jgi:hypothetical protein
MECTTDTLEKDKYSKQTRHFKDPDLVKFSHNMSMTDAQYEKLKAAKPKGMSMGDFISAMVDHVSTLVGFGTK